MGEADGQEHSKSGRPDPSPAIYLYCLARPRVARALSCPGMDGRNPVFAWTFRDVAAVASRVPREEFCGPAAEAHMRELAWVGPRACRHEAVTEKVMRFSPVLPAKFGTLFSSLDSLEQFLRKHHAAITRFLDRVAGKEEWAIKGMLDRSRAREEILSAMLARQQQDLAALSPGKRYFQEQRMQALVGEELSGWVKEGCDNFIAGLPYLTPCVCRRRVLPQAAAGSNPEVVFNCAVLVRGGALAGLRARIDQANARCARWGLSFQLSGPWPPYSFSSFFGKPEA